MSLLDSELTRIRYELGFNALNVGAEPYIGVSALFDQVIQPYLRSGASTTSTTSVTTSTAPRPVSLTLASVTGFSAGARIVVDVDARQEIGTIQSVSGSTVSVLLSLAHSGTYPVTVEGGESIVRGLLAKLRAIESKIESASDKAGIKQVDEIEFFGGGAGGKSESPFDALVRQQTYWCQELCRVLFGVGDIRQLRSRGRGGSWELY